MPKMSKTTRQLIILGVIVGLIVGVLIWVVGGGSGEIVGVTYRGRAVSTEIDASIFEHPVYKKLQSPVRLPVIAGATGRENPFQPFNGQ